MSNDPDQIRAEIAQTRGDLSTNITTLADEMRPSTMVHRQTHKMRSKASRFKDRVMGTASETASSVQSSTQSAVASAEQAVEQAPQMVREQTQGNPMAAGLVAFGLGLLVATLMPPSEKEREAAAVVKDKAEPLTHEATGTAKEIAENLKEPAREAAQSVKDTATEGVQQVQQEGQDASVDLRDDAREAAQTGRAQPPSGSSGL
jgi:ElaB/YqjD/DUF883 family membrane-anchored ribosome-binding protein